MRGRPLVHPRLRSLLLLQGPGVRPGRLREGACAPSRSLRGPRAIRRTPSPRARGRPPGVSPAAGCDAPAGCPGPGVRSSGGRAGASVLASNGSPGEYSGAGTPDCTHRANTGARATGPPDLHGCDPALDPWVRAEERWRRSGNRGGGDPGGEARDGSASTGPRGDRPGEEGGPDGPRERVRPRVDGYEGRAEGAAPWRNRSPGRAGTEEPRGGGESRRGGVHVSTRPARDRGGSESRHREQRAHRRTRPGDTRGTRRIGSAATGRDGPVRFDPRE